MLSSGFRLTIPHKAAMTDHEQKFLIFSLHKSLFAIDLARIAEVGDRPRLDPIPFAPPCYRGALNFHGEIVAVMDLPFFLGLETGHSSKIIILQEHIASLAFLVDRVVSIVSGSETVREAAHEIRFAAETLVLPSGTATLFDLDALVNAAETVMAEYQQTKK